jgi:uncharacterized protein
MLSPIPIGIFEATSIDRRLRGFPHSRPLTHDAAATILTTLGGDLQHVILDEVIDNCWRAKLCLLQNGRKLTVDLRPSDAFTLALILVRPIFLSNELSHKVSRITR